ncbi:glycosyl transferase [Actinoplanes siamensis]|uniref:Glycosyl transferase n=2 Tax=Actinoplanes siamensis TaxID=1223317 RepID=A0A919NDA1_9ACTN|nr:glycosyl transferase [Actinoplanes siamensis]
MRVLFLSTAGIGQVFPLVPLTWAFRAAGHDVLVGTCGESLVTAQAGLLVADIAPGFRMAEFVRSTPIEVGREAARRRDMSFDIGLFAGVNRRLAEGALKLGRAWRPDLVVHEEMAAIGPLVAAAVDVPAVQVSVTFVPAGPLRRDFTRQLADLYAELDVPPARTPPLTLTLTPPSMVEQIEGWPMRFVPYGGGAVQLPWLREPPSRPRVAVTIGTVTPIVEGLGIIRQILTAVADLDAEFVVALGGAAVEDVQPLPDNARAASWIPLDELLPSCAAIIHHGGGGTTMTALAAGVPQLVLPNFADRFINADAVSRRGVGIAADRRDLTADTIPQLLGDSGLRSSAASVAAEIGALPGPADMALRLARHEW